MNLKPIIVHAANSYRGPGELSSEDLQQRIVQLEAFDRFIRQRKDKLLREDSVFDAELTPTKAVWQVLFEENELLSKEMRSILVDLLNRSKEAVAEDFEPNPPAANIGLWSNGADYIGADTDWYRFRRKTLPDCQVTPATFCEQSTLLFPNLVLSSRFPGCLDSLEGGFDLFLPSIIKALSLLNDRLLDTITGYEIKEGLKRFTAISEFETTMEGSADRNSELTFAFRANETEPSKNLVCAPHMKLHTSMFSGDTKHYHNRIYFNSHQNGGVTRIHVGHIGGHL